MFEVARLGRLKCANQRYWRLSISGELLLVCSLLLSLQFSLFIINLASCANSNENRFESSLNQVGNEFTQDSNSRLTNPKTKLAPSNKFNLIDFEAFKVSDKL